MSDKQVASEHINEPNNRIIVNSLSFETDENGLREYFSQYGTVIAVEIPINRSQNRSRGFGFVTFSSIEEATKANDQSLTHELNDRKVRTDFANKKEKENREDGHGIKKLYIGKLPQQVNETELKEYFEQFGKVSDAFISTVKFAPELNGYPQHKGYGFVTFESDEDANKAVKHKSHVLKNTNIFVRKAIPQNDEKSPKDRRNKGERKNKGGRRNNEGRNNEGRRNKEGSSSQSKTSDSQQDTTTSTPSTSTTSSTSNNNSNSSGEKKAVVVKRKEDTKTEGGSSSSTQTSNTATSSTNNTSISSKPTTSNKSKIVVNQAPKTTIVISKNPVNPWTKSQSTNTQPQSSEEYPTLGGKKKPNVKKTTTTTTTVTTTIINEKDDKEEN